MARVLDVSGRGFYAWLERPRSPQVLEDERLKVALRAAPVKSRDTYGAKRWPPEWQAEGFTVGRDRIARLRRQLGRGGKQKRNFQPTPPPHHAWPVAENLLGQGVEATAPNEVWHTAITSLSSGDGGLSLAGVKDQFTGPIVGYARGTRLPQERVGQALWGPIRSQRPAAGLIHQSDRGSQYGALEYQRLRPQHRLLASLSGTGNCDDNAPMESVWGRLKNQLVHHQRYDTRAEAEASIREDIEIFYNRQRRHSRLGNVAAAVFAQHFCKPPRAA